MYQLHEHEFTLLLAYAPLNIVWTHLCSYVGPIVGAWLLACLSTFSFHLSFAHFLTTFYIGLGIPHPMVPHFSQCQCGHTIDDLGIHLLRCLCGSERIIAHDTLWETIAAIASKSEAHVQREVSHLFFHCTQRWMDIVIIIDGFGTLVDVVIADLICTDLVQRISTMIIYVAIVATQDKAQSYT